jgi:hypothetical protein
MPIGRVVGFLLMTAAVTEQKCAVLPLSAMAMESGGMVVGGPTEAIDRQEPESLITLDVGQVSSRVGVVGSPRRQLVVVVES